MWRWVKSCSAVGGDVAVVVEVGLDGRHELGLVLLVVGGERRDRLRVEALQLGRVLAHRRQQQAVGAGVLEGEQRAPVGLGDVGREPRLLAGAVEVDGVARRGGCGRPSRESRAATRRARGRAPAAARGSLLGARPAGTIAVTSARSPSPVELGERARARRAQRAQGERRAPARASRRSGPLAGAARAISTPAPAPTSAPSSAARATMSPRSVTWRVEQRADELARGLVARPLGRARALQLERQQRRHHPRHGRRRLAPARPVAQLADLRVGDPQLERPHVPRRPRAASPPRPGGCRRTGEHGARAVDQRHAARRAPPPRRARPRAARRPTRSPPRARRARRDRRLVGEPCPWREWRAWGECRGGVVDWCGW